MSGSKPDPDCTARCRSLLHGGAVASCLTVRCATEAAIVAHLRATCANCCQVVDPDGRTALHMAAACGRNRVARWLAQHKECNINARDTESGYTPLHRSLFYGQIHVAASLIQLGASLAATDNDGLTAIDHVMADRLPTVDLSLNSPCEVYVWGTNANYSLGTGNQHSRPLPELLETFRKQNISVKQVAMHKFHSVFVSHDGRAFSCGHGQGGRLGLGTEQAVLTPRPIALPSAGGGELWVAASVGRDHTALLTDAGNVYTCGLNAHHQLGVTPPPPHALAPALVGVRGLRGAGGVAGVCAARFHTVVWGPKGVVTFGLHGGQLGHPRGAEKTIVKPKVVAAFNLKDCCITQVSSSDGAVVVATDKGQVFLLHDYECRRIASRLKAVVKVAVVGGHLDPRLDKLTLMDRGGERLRVLALTEEGWLMLWQEETEQFNSCVFTLNRLLLLRDVVMTHHQLLLVSWDGEAFLGEIRPRKERKAVAAKRSLAAVTRLPEKPDVEVIAVTKLPHVHRAVSAAGDVKGRSFALLQTHPKQALVDIPQLITSRMREQMRALLTEADEGDAIHDVVFQIGTRRFPAHQFIVASSNAYLGQLIADQVANCSSAAAAVTVCLEDVQPEVFQQFLQYMYTGECDMMTLGICPVPQPDSSTSQSVAEQELRPVAAHESDVSAFAVYSSESKKSKKNKAQATRPTVGNAWDPIRIVQKAASRFQMTDLCRVLDGFSYQDGYVVPRGGRRAAAAAVLRWDRAAHARLCDVTIVGEDKRELRAHKCVLAARLEYFHSMLSQGWREASATTLKLSLPHDILQVLIDFLYEDRVSAEIRDSEDPDLLGNLLVVADQLFVQRLKEQCEVALVNTLTLRNAAELLQLADTYNATQLRDCCMQYVCLNLGAVLEARTLEGVNPELLAALSQYYLALNPAVQKRNITPYSVAPSITVLEAALEANPFEFTAQSGDVGGIVKRELKQQVKKKPRVRKNSNDGAKAVDRRRNESVSSIASDDLDHAVEPFSFEGLTEKTKTADEISTSAFKENIDKNGQWVKITPNGSKQQKIVQARLKAINASKDPSFLVEASRESFTRLSRSTPSPTLQKTSDAVPTPDRVTSSPPVELTWNAPVVTVKSMTQSDFPELNSSPNAYHPVSNYHKNDKTTPKLVESKKIVKISQKQRKRLTSANDLGLMADHLDAINQSPPPPPPPAWGRKSPAEADNANCSLVDIIRQELRQVRLVPMVVAKPTVPTVEVLTKKVVGNPWGKVASPDFGPISSKAKSAVSFTQIVADEKKQKDNLTKMLAKPLELTQIEDQAISDLLQFYNAAGATEERITVRRCSMGPIAVPTWITNH